MLYSVSLFFSGIHLNKNLPSLWEEKIVLMEAFSEDEAGTKAEKWAVTEEPCFEVEDGDVVQWKFVCIERICAVDSDSLSDGLEIFSRFLSPQEASSLLKKIEITEN